MEHFKALISDVFGESVNPDSMDDEPITEPDAYLDAACIAYLEARGYVCLRKHTEAPTEEGRYVIVTKDRDGLVSWSQQMRRVGKDLDFARKHDPTSFALGPLPEGK